MSGSVGGSGGGGGSDAIQGAQNAAQSSYISSTVEDVKKEAEFSKMQGEGSIANTMAKANPTS